MKHWVLLLSFLVFPVLCDDGNHSGGPAHHTGDTAAEGRPVDPGQPAVEAVTDSTLNDQLSSQIEDVQRVMFGARGVEPVGEKDLDQRITETPLRK